MLIAMNSKRHIDALFKRLILLGTSSNQSIMFLVLVLEYIHIKIALKESTRLTTRVLSVLKYLRLVWRPLLRLLALLLIRLGDVWSLLIRIAIMQDGLGLMLSLNAWSNVIVILHLRHVLLWSTLTGTLKMKHLVKLDIRL